VVTQFFSSTESSTISHTSSLFFGKQIKERLKNIIPPENPDPRELNLSCNTNAGL